MGPENVANALGTFLAEVGNKTSDSVGNPAKSFEDYKSIAVAPAKSFEFRKSIVVAPVSPSEIC